MQQIAYIIRLLRTGPAINASALEKSVIRTTESSDAVSWSSSTYQQFSWIGQHAPCFPIRGEQMLVLTEPTQFFEVLKVEINLIFIT